MTLTREQLLHLADRARRGALLPDEGTLLADGVVDLAKHADQIEDLLRIAHETSNKSEAERARAAATVASVRALHQPAPGGSGGLSFNSGSRCAACDHPYRCDTIRTLDQAQQPTT